MSAECALQNLSVRSAIEKRSPLLKLADAIGSFLGMKLRHPPVVEEFAAPHSVAKMCAPIVGGIDIGHRRSDSTSGHYSVRFAEEGLANHSYFRTLSQCAQRRTQAGTARSDD